ncbi:MAG: hypothetical protein H0U53_10270 [Actinobacteria bacterium]|nr:hypothetical protein [Actinomycetota bacterium]
MSPEQVAEQEREHATDLIADLWRGFSDSWDTGLASAYQYMEEHNHPAMGCTAADYESYYQFVEGTELEIIVDQDSVELDEGWVSPAIGDVPEGTIYIFTINATSTASQPELLEVHAAILDGEAFFFYECR